MQDQDVRRKDAFAKVDRDKRYPLEEACALIKPTSFAKFDESVDIAVRLGVNPRHADQMVRGALVLPHGIGKTQARAGVRQGARRRTRPSRPAPTSSAPTTSSTKVQDGFLDFDTVIATPDMMGQVGRLGRVLGPRGLMPNPKVGTVTADVKKAVGEAKAGKIEFRVEKAGIVHAPVGKKSFDAEQASRRTSRR